MIENAYAMAPPQGGQEGASPSSGFLGILPPMIAMFVIFYFLLIRPQQKKQKEHDAMLKSLKEGDNVLTSGGIYGTIRKIKDDVLTVQIADNVRVKVSRKSVSDLKDKISKNKK
ncbi:MAG: preprotein translocase subunit YajC [Nitrospinota bacterium]